MKRTDAFKRIVLSLALISFIGCSDTKSEKNKLKKQTADAEASNAKSLATIKQYEEQLALVEKEKAELITGLKELEASQTDWSESRGERLIQLQNLDAQIDALTAELNTLSKSRESLQGLVVAEQADLEATKVEIADAQEALDKEIKAQKEVVLKANAEANKIQSSAKVAAKKATAATVKAANDKEAAAQAELDKLKDIKAGLDQRQEEIRDEESRLVLFVSELQNQKIAIEKVQATIKVERAKFAKQIVAARKLFFDNGKEQVFKGLVAGKSYPFMISLVGTGDYEILKLIRADILKETSKTKYAKHNMMNPLTKDTKDAGVDKKDIAAIVRNSKKYSPKKQIKLKDGRWFIDSVLSSDSVNVKDAFLMDATIESIVDLERALNEKIESTYSKAIGINGANFWVSVRSVDDVQVSAEISLYGTEGYGPNKKIQRVTTVFVNPEVVKRSELSGVDLTNLSAKIFGDDEKGCSVIDTKCLSFLKETGALNATDKKGNSFERTLIEALNDSIRKIQLEQQFGFGVNTINLPTIVDIKDNSDFVEWWTGESESITFKVADETKKSIMAEMRTDFKERQALSKSPTIQGITLSLRVKSIFKVGEGRITTDAGELMNLGSISDTAINKSDVLERGVVEVIIPVRGVNRTYSNLSSLNLLEYKTGFSAPVKPTVKAIGTAAAKTDVERKALNKKFKEEMSIYKVALAEYKAKVEGANAAEYKKRLDDLRFELKTMKKALEE